MASSLAASLATSPAAGSLSHAGAGEAVISPPSRRVRIVAALVMGLVVAGYVFAREYEYPQWGADIVQSWAGA